MPSSPFDPFDTLRQILLVLPASQNWNSWTQLPSSSANFEVKQPNSVPAPKTSGQNTINSMQKNGFNSNYNYNFGGKHVNKYGVDFPSSGNSPATTGFPGSSNLHGLRPSTTNKSTLPDDFDGRFFPSESLFPSTQQQKRPNFKSSEKLSEQSFLPRNITEYWIF